MKSKRVVITGLGAITPIGNNIYKYWNALVSGISGADFITYFDTTKFKTKFACEIKGYYPNNFFSKKEQRRIDIHSQYGLIAAKEAIYDSRLNLSIEDMTRIGVIWGSGIGGLLNFEKEIMSYFKGSGIPKFTPFFIPKMIIDNTSGLISITYGFRGPSYATVSACASSANAIVNAYHLICLDEADIIITGGSEAPITECGIGGFNSLNALSTKNKYPKIASCPFDKSRDGFVMGEGAGCLVLENYEHAKNRNAIIYAEIIGIGLSSDAYHITKPIPNGDGIILAIENAIKNANIKSSDIDYINTHGTSTILGDLSEIKALKKVFKKDLYKKNINSTKSMTGHLLGAAGVIEVIATILPFSKKIIPPTINLSKLDDNIDPDINFTANIFQKRKINISMCNTFGFGGHNVCILFSK